MTILIDVLAFRRMVAPILLQILFWGGIGGTVYGAYVLFTLGNWAWWIALVGGICGTRVIFEVAILAFRIFDRLGEIHETLRTSFQTLGLSPYGEEVTWASTSGKSTKR